MPASRFQIWIQAARPKTLPAAVAPVLIGTAMTGTLFHWPAAVAAMIGALLIQIGTNFANDYFDFKKGIDTEERLGPVRATSAGLVSPEAMKRATVIVFSLALLVGVYLVWRGGWPIVAIGLLSILFGVLYTGGPYPLGYNGWGDLFVLIFFGPVAVGGTYYVQTLDINATVVIAGLAPGLFSVAILTVNNLRDLDNDRAGGKKTLAVRFGRIFTLIEYRLAMLLGCLIPIPMILLDESHTLVLAATVVLIPAFFAMRKVSRVRGRELNDCLAQSGQILLLYSLIFSVAWIV
jgi:1,4-dihydroxy-2-naphthoate octaprenyltransferase